MRKSILFICLTISAYTAVAQNAVMPKKADSNSVKLSKLEPSTLKLTDGATMLPANDIVTNIAHSKELSTFNKAITITGFAETFKSIGPITVFAPSDKAFSSLSKGKLDSLLAPEHKFDLIALVSYHAIPGKISAKDIAHEINTHKGVATFTTLSGSKLMAKLDAKRNIVLVDENGGQSIISRFDIKQNNGLVHITNGVLIPKFKNI